MTLKGRLITVIAIFITLFMIGGTVIAYFVSGLLIFLSFVVMVQNIDWLRSFVYHTNRLMDVMIFSFAIYAKMNYGVTIAMSITIAGLLYSFIYVPYLREVYKALDLQKKRNGKRSSRQI